MTETTTSKGRIRLLQLLSVPSLAFLTIFLAASFLLGGIELATLIGIGVLVGLIAAAMAVTSRHAGTFRFTLSSLLIAMTAIAGLFVWHQNRRMSQEDAITAIRGIGGTVRFQQPTSQNSNGVECSAQIIKKPIEPDDLRYLSSLDNLISLDLDYCHFGDKGLRHVGKLTDLQRLDIEDTAITDDGLKRLAQLQALEYIIVDGNDISDAGLMHLVKLKSLKRVRVRNTNVTKTGAAEFEKRLPGCKVSGD